MPFLDSFPAGDGYIIVSNCVLKNKLDRVTLILLLTALAVRLAVLLAGPGILNGDGLLYVSAAQHMVETGMAPPANFQPRTFSAFLAPLVAMTDSSKIQFRPGAHPLVDMIHIIQVFLDLGVILLMLKAFLSFRPTGVWTMRGGLLAIILQPITASTSNLVLPEAIATISFFAGTMLLARSRQPRADVRRFAGAGLLLGIAGLLRFDLLLLGACLIVLWLGLLAFQAPRKIMSRGLGAAVLLQGDARYFVIRSPDNPVVLMPGYAAWVRGWAMKPSEAFGVIFYATTMKGWAGFDASHYPDRAFANPAERKRTASALAMWQAEGYTPTVDAELARTADTLAHAKPFQRWLLAPGARTAQLWFNASGGAAINFTFNLQPPLTWIVAGIVFCLKLMLIIFAVIGGRAIARQLRADRMPYARALDWPFSMAFLSAAAILGRIAEMFALNAGSSAAVIMEARYVVTLWPNLIVLALYGWLSVVKIRGNDTKLECRS